MSVTKVINIKVDVDGDKNVKQLEKDFKNVDNSIKDTNASTKSMGNVLDKATGGAITKFNAFKGSLKSVAGGFKTLRTAIISTGIGALVVVVTSLIAAFKGSEEGQNRFAKLMGVIGAVVGNVVDVLADLGDFIIDLFSGNGAAMNKLKSFGSSIFNVIGLPIKNVIDTVKALGKALGALFSGDISGAFDELKQGVQDVKNNFNEAKQSIDGATDSLKDFAKQNIEEAKAAAKVADQRAKADKIERDLILDKAKAEREIADLRLKARDLNNTTAKEREDALTRVLEISDELIAREQEVAQLRADAQAAENTFARSNKENLTAEEEAKARVIRLETERLNQQRQIQRELTQAQNEQRREREANAKEAEAKRKELLDKRKAEIGSVLQLEGEPIEVQRARITANAIDKIDLEATAKAAEQAEARKLIAEYEAEGKREALMGYAGALSQISGILGQETAAGKAIAISSSLINTYASITGQLKAFAGVPVPGYAIAQAIATGAVGFANVAKIASVKVPNSKGGGAGISGAGASGGGGAAAAPSFNVVGTSGVNQLAESLQQDQQPVQAYVVGSNVTTQQELDRNIVDTVSLG